MISWPPWVRVWGWASDRFLPLTVFSLCLPICFSGYSVRLRCTSEGGSLVNVCCPAVLLSLLSGLYRVSTRITCIQPLLRCSLTLHASSFFSESVCCCCRCFVFSLLSSTIRLSFYLWLIGQFVPAVSLPD